MYSIKKELIENILEKKYDFNPLSANDQLFHNGYGIFNPPKSCPELQRFF